MKKFILAALMVLFISTPVIAEDTIQPFGTFEWGDTSSEVHQKLCAMEGNFNVKTNSRANMSKETFCASTANASLFMPPTIDNPVDQFMRDEIYGEFKKSGLDYKGLKIVTGYSYGITVSSVDIMGAKYEMELSMSDVSNDYGLWQIENKPDSLDTLEYKGVNYIAPLVLNRVYFDLNDESKTTIDSIRPLIYKALQAKYSEWNIFTGSSTEMIQANVNNTSVLYSKSGGKLQYKCTVDIFDEIGKGLYDAHVRSTAGNSNAGSL